MNTTQSLTNRVVFITGAARGIGAATACELHGRGAKVALFDRDHEALQATAAALGDGSLALPGDTLDSASLHSALDATVAAFGGIDVVWANAGIASFGPLALTDASAWELCLTVNVLGTYRTVQAALPLVSARRGLIAVTASAASFAHAPGMSAYAASKAAVEAMCNAWRIELAALGVDVLCIHPSWIATDMVSEAAQTAAFRRLRSAMRGPLGRSTPVQTAAVAVAQAIATRRRRVFVPGWVRYVYALRALLHLRPFERDLLAAAPLIEEDFRQEVAQRGRVDTSASPRIRQQISRS